MKILLVSAEVAPLAKVGGLADVAGSLPKALRAMGHDVRIAMPGYALAKRDGFSVERLARNLPVRLNSAWTELAALTRLDLDGVPVWLIDSAPFFREADTSGEVYGYGPEAYVFFSRAVLDACTHSGWIPDVVHANDWHSGLIPVLMREGEDRRIWESVGSVFTIHNLAYQGEFDPEVLSLANLPERLFTFDKLETFGTFNFLKAGCVFADRVNTVSERYAREIQTEPFGCRLHGLMAHLSESGRLSGILNGIDTELYDPETDARIAASFSREDLVGKSVCRDKFFQELGMEPIAGAPLAGVVSRLSEQKGMDSLHSIAAQLPELPLQLYVQGIGDPCLASRFSELQSAFPRHVRFVEKFDPELAQRAYAASDLFLMPSAFEPCGLGQMIAMRYGTIPVVRETGGLADTVFEGKNGFVFQNLSGEALLEALRRAVAAFHKPRTWSKLVRAALGGEYGWEGRAELYVSLFLDAIGDRPDTSAVA